MPTRFNMQTKYPNPLVRMFTHAFSPFQAGDLGASLILDFRAGIYGMQAAGGTSPQVKQFSDLVTFTRASGGSFYDGGGVVRQAGVNIPRFDTDPISFQPKGLLIEEARTNICLQSAALGTGPWAGSQAGTGVLPIVTNNFGIGPDGNTSTTAIVFNAPAGGDLSIQTQNFATTATNTYQSSFWVKAKTAGDIGKVIIHRQAAASAYTTVTLQAGFQRVGSSEVAAGASANYDLGLRPAVGSSTGSVGVEIWGCQEELGAFTTSYIPTTTTTQTRAADTASVNTLSPWYNGAGQTLFGNYIQYVGITTNAYVATLAPVAAGSYLGLHGKAGSQSGWFASGPASTILTLGLQHKQALTDAGVNFTQCGDGGTVFSSGVSDYTGTSTSLAIGQQAGTLFLNGWIAQLKYFPIVFSNPNLQALTT